jgi:hypothetical protein
MADPIQTNRQCVALPVNTITNTGVNLVVNLVVNPVVRLAATLVSLALATSPAAHADAGGTTAPTSGRAIDARAQGPTIPMASAAGQMLLFGGQTRRADFAPLAQHYETQANLAFCGVASAVMALNSLAIAAPPAEGYGRYRFWTQINLFQAPATLSFVQAERVRREGMSLEQLHGLLNSTANDSNLIVRRYHGSQLDLAHFRLLLRRNLSDASNRILVNYDRRLIGQPGGGHISPLAAYDTRSDRVLILDVARYRYPAAWVAVPALWQAIRSIDTSSGLSRGLIEIGPR